jgi:hypothetical protein
MVPATRQMSSGAAYSHFLNNVFSLPQGHPIRLSFEQQGYNSVDDLLSIFLNELDALGYVPSASPDTNDPQWTPLLMAH